MPKELSVDSNLQAQIGPIKLWFKYINDEMHFAYEHLSEEITSIEELTDGKGDLPADLDWTRFVVGTKIDSLQLLPITPDRPVVVRPVLPLTLPPEQNAEFSVGIPLWIQILVHSNSKKLELAEVPSVIRSNIWFGDTLSGELCYSLKTRARREFEDIEDQPFRMTCPVKIFNRSEENLRVERFCIRVEHLKILVQNNQLWTNEVSIDFQGENEVSKIDYGRKSSRHGSKCELLNKPRNPIRESLWAKSIGHLGLTIGN